MRALRLGCGLTMRELADELGYSAHGHLGAIEQGLRMPSLDVVLRISTFFSVSLDLLLRDSFSVEEVLTALPARSNRAETC